MIGGVGTHLCANVNLLSALAEHYLHSEQYKPAIGTEKQTDLRALLAHLCTKAMAGLQPYFHVDFILRLPKLCC